MHPITPARRLLITVAVTSVAFAGPASAGPAKAVSAAGANQGAYARLHSLADLAARRLATADSVAAAKWGTGRPVDDPVREKQVLDTVARQAHEAGADPVATVRIFRAQIEANKRVQRALHERWKADPSRAPADRPDLAAVRAEINRLNSGLLRAVARSEAVRTAPSCGGTLTAAQARVLRDRHLDPLHAAALSRALRPVCTRPSAQPSGNASLDRSARTGSVGAPEAQD